MLIAHLSDPHLRTDALAGEPAQRLHAALGRILGIDPRPDAVVITGDLVEHDHPGAYAHLRDLLDAVPIPVHLVAGNHDDRAAMLDAFAGTGHLAGGTSTRYVVEHDQASIVVLDSGGAGAQGGHLGAEEGVAEVGALAGRMHPCFVRTCETPALGASPRTVGAACLTAGCGGTMELRQGLWGRGERSWPRMSSGVFSRSGGRWAVRIGAGREVPGVTSRGHPVGTTSQERLTALFRQHSPRVLAYLLHRGAGEAAPDLLSETFAVAWRRIDDVAEEALPWLLVVARNVLAHHWRATGRVRALEQAWALDQRGEGVVGDVGEDVAERKVSTWVGQFAWSFVESVGGLIQAGPGSGAGWGRWRTKRSGWAV